MASSQRDCPLPQYNHGRLKLCALAGACMVPCRHIAQPLSPTWYLGHRCATRSPQGPKHSYASAQQEIHRLGHMPVQEGAHSLSAADILLQHH